MTATFMWHTEPIVGEIKEVSRSYKEARMALDVGKIFFEEKDVIAYSTLWVSVV